MPFIPILEDGENPYSMFKDLTKYDWVLKPVVIYRTPNELLAHFKEVIVERGVRKRQELQRKRDAELELLPIDQLIKKKE
jgi:hypothetical protein